jgi:hypothetical protein
MFRFTIVENSDNPRTVILSRAFRRRISRDMSISIATSWLFHEKVVAEEPRDGI